MGTASPVDRQSVLARIADEVRACQACPLHEGTRNAVPGEGNPNAEVMLIGEAPGQNEDLQGRPFVDFLQRQIDIIDPLVIVTLGRFSMARYFPGEKISRIHGQPKIVRGRVILPLYHPAAALHQGALRKVLEADFATLPNVVERARRRREHREADVTAPSSTDDAALRPDETSETRIVRDASPRLSAPVQASFGLMGIAKPDPEGVTPTSSGTPQEAPPRQLPLL